ncbi:unnamed protein product [Prorocentrum cordatum]|uniref:Uncharacterized protein n=1 Tax=Prorocentrum cordatum TaxID=2364126 RepID=A0ABN9SQZ4_9DINO|nr:unnamed protein product [Polarella glacialis]
MPAPLCRLLGGGRLPTGRGPTGAPAGRPALLLGAAALASAAAAALSLAVRRRRAQGQGPQGGGGPGTAVGGEGVSRSVVCGDALEWLRAQAELPGSVVTSLPDVTELSYLKMSVEEYRVWFVAAAREILRRAPPLGVVVFYQTDFRLGGVWVDKSFLCSLAAQEEGASLLFHKGGGETSARARTLGGPRGFLQGNEP